MQLYPQPPSQGGYPQFQNDPQQPGPQHAFNVALNNPHHQPQQTQGYVKSQQPHPQQGQQYVPPHQPGPQYTQRQQPGQTYIAPTQYSVPVTSNLQTNSAAPENDNRLAQMETKLVDQRLSSGCYACYNCWLYVILIGAILGLYTNAACMISRPFYFFAFLEALATFGYALTMINVMKSKKMSQAVLGVKFAFATSLLLPGTIYAQYSWYAEYTEYAKYIFYMCIPYAIYYYFVMILPALKIRNYIQSRDTILRKSTDPYYA